jgi:hypothetical protein
MLLMKRQKKLVTSAVIMIGRYRNYRSTDFLTCLVKLHNTTRNFTIQSAGLYDGQ